MFRDKKLTIAIIVVLIISVIGLGIAFAAFSQTLTINGTGTVESSKWQVVFEGMTNPNIIDDPVLTGSAKEVTHPTIKNNSTEISNYSVTLATPGDSITYNFKIHNKGDYAADVSTLTIAGVTNPTSSIGVSGANLVTDSSIATANTNTLLVTYYQLYYTDNNITVGLDDAKDCLEPGETVNVTLKIWFSSTSASNPNILPASDLTLDNLGVSILYNQHANGYCYYEGGERETVTDAPFINYDGAYYTFEGKRFIGTGVNNVIISENVIGKAKYASAFATECSDGSIPTGSYFWNKMCPEGTTPVFADHPAADVAATYCTGCRLMTHSEANLWCGPDYSPNSKCIGKYNDSTITWFLADAYSSAWAYQIYWNDGRVSQQNVMNLDGVRPAVDIPSNATMTGSGTSTDPYVITTN